jgi:hypothetical protein
VNFVGTDVSVEHFASIVFSRKMDAIYSSATSVPTRTTRRRIPEDDILQLSGEFLIFCHDFTRFGQINFWGPEKHSDDLEGMSSAYISTVQFYYIVKRHI